MLFELTFFLLESSADNAVRLVKILEFQVKLRQIVTQKILLSTLQGCLVKADGLVNKKGYLISKASMILPNDSHLLRRGVRRPRTDWGEPSRRKMAIEAQVTRSNRLCALL